MDDDNPRIEMREWMTSDGETVETRTETVAIERVAVADADRLVTRISLDAEGNFTTVELHVDYEDRTTSLDTDDGYASQAFVTWNGAVVRAVDGSTGALWARSADWEGRAEAISIAHEVWEAYRMKSPEFRDKWSFIAYAWEDHLEGFENFDLSVDDD